MVAFRDFAEFAAEPLALPYRGKVYTLPEVSIELGVRLTIELADPESDFARLPVDEGWALLLGDALTEMRADGVPVRFVSRCFLTALADFQYGREHAQATWEAGMDPKALEAFYLSREEQEAAALEGSTSTAEETSTP